MLLSSLTLVVLSFVDGVWSFGGICRAGTFDPLVHSAESLHIDVAKERHSDIKVALFADQGLSWGAETVMRMVQTWGADFVIHAGDFDYDNSPDKFEKQIRKVFDKRYPYFATIGNHDVKEWDGYSNKLRKRLEKGGHSKHCRGEYGINMVCNFKGIVFVLSGIGTMGDNHLAFIDHAFLANPGKWKICAWHKNQHSFQPGTKVDETGYGVYEMCRKHGAIILTGHEHSFGRTYVMSSFANKTVHSTRSVVEIGPGRTFAVIAGASGRDIRPFRHDIEKDHWWAALGASNNGLNYGAMFCTFYAEGKENEAHCEFKDLTGKVWDDFLIRSSDKLEVDIEEDRCTYPVVETHLLPAAPTDSLTKYDSDDFLFLSKHPSYLMMQDPDSRPEEHDDVSILTFENKLLPEYTVNSARMQFMVADAQGLATMKIRGIYSGTMEQTQAVVEWKEHDDEEPVENGEVWLTPNLKPIVDELLKRGDSTFTFRVESHGVGAVRKVYGTADECMIPALSIHMNALCK